MIIRWIQSALLCILVTCHFGSSMYLAFCPGVSYVSLPKVTNGSTNESLAIMHTQEKVEASIGLDVKKSCMEMHGRMAEDANHFYIVGSNDSVILNSGACGRNEFEMKYLLEIALWSVVLRKENKHHPLFAYPVNPSDAHWLKKSPMIHSYVVKRKVHEINEGAFCLTQTGQLMITQFKADLAGTYFLQFRDPHTGKSDNVASKHTVRTYHHVDFTYDNEDMYEGVHVRQIPTLAPKVTMKRMYNSAEPNLRYQYRTVNSVVRAREMDPGKSKDPKAKPNHYPFRTFKDFPIKMMWLPPPELHQFTQWKPNCGTRITRERYMQCAVEVDVGKLERWLGTWTGATLTMQSNYDKKVDGGPYKNIHGLLFMYMLFNVVKRLQVQLVAEARETPTSRPFYEAGFRWTETRYGKLGTTELTKIIVPCHYSFLHHLPKSAVMEESGASIYIPNIGNIGEREQGIRLCGLADPLELLRMLGQVLVAQLRKLVNISRRRPVVPKRTVVFRDKTMYMKCPVDLHAFERPVCNMQGKEDNVLWTLNDKTIRFFSSTADRGPSLTTECALVIRKIGYNDAGWYACYRTPTDSRSIEKVPAYRHYVDVLKPDFDPPTVEEVYFGLAVCFAWIGCLLLLWTTMAITRSFFSLLYSGSSAKSQSEVWTSFYDDLGNDDFVREATDEDPGADDSQVNKEDEEDWSSKFDDQEIAAYVPGIDPVVAAEDSLKAHNVEPGKAKTGGGGGGGGLTKRATSRKGRNGK